MLVVVDFLDKELCVIKNGPSSTELVGL